MSQPGRPDDQRLAAYRADVAGRYAPRHPGLRRMDERWIEPAVVAAVRDGSAEALRGVITEVHPRLFTLRLLTPEWCRLLLEEADHFAAWASRDGVPIHRPNSMHGHGIVLDDVGLSEALATLMSDWLRPFAAELYPDLGGGDLDDHHGFVARYELSGDRDLAFHVDDAEVTLNLCLGERFHGGDLAFHGLRCALHRQDGCSREDSFRFAHEPGLALLHAGKHRHQALSITGGVRRNLILWCRSGAHREAERAAGPVCPDWCRESRAR